MRPVKFFLPLALLAAFALSACNTLENRRSLYTYEKVHGPYTRELEEGTVYVPQRTVDQQYAASRRAARRPKVIYSKPATPSGTSAAPASGADTAMPQ